MSRRLVHFRHDVRHPSGLAVVTILALAFAATRPGLAPAGPAEGKEGLSELGKADSRLKGYYVPRGFKVRVIAAEPAVVDPACMAFDDAGNLFVAEWKPADHAVETWDNLALPEGGTARIRRGRKSSLDVVKRLKDADGDGVYESSEVVVDGCELPTAILPWKNSLYLACVGRLERWVDEDGDGKFESRTVLVDGFAAADRRGLSGITLGPDGWLYLTSGDDDNRLVGPDGSRVDLTRSGGVFRCRVDGTRLQPFAMGLGNPYRGLAFDGSFQPFLFDDDVEDGSKFQGVRLVNLVEEGDYGWRLRPGSPTTQVDFDRAAVNGERPGKLPVVARVGRGSPAGLVIYNGSAFPEALRETLIEAEPARRLVRGFKVEPAGDSYALKGESTLMTADDDQFRPSQVTVGADGALYILDHRGHAADGGDPWGEGQSGRLYRITWEGDGVTPSLATKPNHWKRIIQASNDDLATKLLASPDYPEADRALRELIDRGPGALIPCLTLALNAKAPVHARLVGIQGARQFWNDQVEAAMIAFLDDPQPEVRRLAAQSIAWEPKAAIGRLVPKLTPHLDDPDGRVAREVALTLGRHAEPRPQQTVAILLRWLFAHPKAQPAVKDAFLRALERLGDAGVEEVALAVRTRSGLEREMAVGLFASLRSAPAAEQLVGLVKLPDLTATERRTLVRQFVDVPAPTQGLVEWLGKHDEVDPSVKVAALDACRLSGNPASSLVIALLDDEDESVRLAASRVAARFRPPGALEKLVKRLDDKATPTAERLAILRALRSAGPKSFAALDSAYLAAEDPALRRAALRSMTEADRVKTIPALESALSGPDPALRAEAVRILGESPKTAPFLGKAFLNRTLGRADLPAVLAALRKLDGAEAHKLLASVEEDGSRGSAAIGPAEIRTRLAQGGDPWAGLGVFFRESSRCSSCHQVEGRGVAFGPSLTLNGSAPSADHLIESILDPSKEVPEKFEPARVALKGGRMLAGIVTTKEPRGLVVREPDGREYRVAAESIDKVSKDSESPMPANVGLDLTPDELADVVAFLQSKPAQGALKHGPRRLERVLAIGPFPLGADRLRIPLDRLDPSKVFAGQDGAWLGWISRESGGPGVLNFRGDFKSKPGRAYLAVQIRSTVEQSAALRFGVEGAARVYLNGSRVADVTEHDPSSLAQAFDRPRPGALAPLPDLARISLNPGWNLLIVAIDRLGEEDARAAFEIASPEPIEMRNPRN